jgi:cytochrome c oxidase subunit 1
MASITTADAHGAHDHHHDEHHHELGFWQKYVFSTDHKVIGISVWHHRACSSCFFGFLLMLSCVGSWPIR